MDNLRLSELVGAVNGEFILGDPHLKVPSISVDTRTLRKGEFYFAIQGRHFDGHEFLLQAVEREAGGLVISRTDINLGNPFPGIPALIKVNDTTEALGSLASYYRKRWNVQLAGITGSNGKTTTKEMLSSILRIKDKVLSTAGNFNNLIGMPLTLFKLGPEYKYAVIEMGSSLPGEIAKLAGIAQPLVGVITNIGDTHLENLRDREGVFNEKKALFDSLSKEGFAVINADDEYLSKYRESVKCNSITFSVEHEADVYASNIKLWPGKPSFDLRIGDYTAGIRLPIYGGFNIANAVAAAAAAWVLGIDFDSIKNGLESVKLPSMRMEVKKLLSGTIIINDAYNANPTSLKASVASIVNSFPDREIILVLGDMLELGSSAATEHEKIGEFLLTQPISNVLLHGPLMEKAIPVLSGINAMHFIKKEELEEELRKRITSKSLIFFKASRSMHMEDIINNLFSEEEEYLTDMDN